MTDHPPMRRGLPRPERAATAPGVAPPNEVLRTTDDRSARRGLPRAAGAPAESPRSAVESVVAASSPKRPAPEARTGGWWPTIAPLALLIGFAATIIAAAVVMIVRSVIVTPPLQDFLTTYPGEYPLPAGAEQGFPPWVQWQHYFNVFFMVLIVRTGLQVRTQERPPVFWTPKWSKGGRGKVSLSLWFHQSLDVLWFANGVVFVVLLFATGHWMRIVPTSWEVFPNALSAALQYASLDWPTENGWVNYNSLQQLAYFVTVFVAAPLAAVTGIRMSSIWPKHARMNRLYPIEWARAVHFPVMLYFVAFTIVHVALVLATGALRNLNHMYAGTDEVSWVGLLIFLASMALIAAVWIVVRPMMLAAIAGVTGKISSR